MIIIIIVLERKQIIHVTYGWVHIVNDLKRFKHLSMYYDTMRTVYNFYDDMTHALFRRPRLNGFLVIGRQLNGIDSDELIGAVSLVPEKKQQTRR